jgi:hypothetical protein
MAEVDAQTEKPAEEGPSVAIAPSPAASDLPPVNPEEEERLISELERATAAAAKAASTPGPGEPEPPPAEGPDAA